MNRMMSFLPSSAKSLECTSAAMVTSGGGLSGFGVEVSE